MFREKFSHINRQLFLDINPANICLVPNRRLFQIVDCERVYIMGGSRVETGVQTPSEKPQEEPKIFQGVQVFPGEGGRVPNAYS